MEQSNKQQGETISHNPNHPHHPNEKTEGPKQLDYNSFTAQDGNLVWAGALTLAWKELISYANQDQKTHKINHFIVHGQNKQCQAIAHNYSKSQFTKGCLQQKSYYIKSGKGQDTVTQINTQRALKFPQCSLPPVKGNLGENGIISYAYIYKKVMYPVKFERRQKYLRFKNKNKEEKHVPSFFTDDRNQEEQVYVYEYNSNQDFILRIITEKDGQHQDQIYLYMHEEELSVKQVIQKIIKVSKESISQKQAIDQSNNFQVPVLDLDYTRQVTELIGATLLNYGNRVIQSMTEGIKLKLDENGARVQNDGCMFTNECAVMNPRIYRFDRPFWLIMKQKNQHPYLCIKINNI